MNIGEKCDLWDKMLKEVLGAKAHNKLKRLVEKEIDSSPIGTMITCLSCISLLKHFRLQSPGHARSPGTGFYNCTFNK